MFNIQKNYTNFTMIYNFDEKEWKLGILQKLAIILHDTKEYLGHIQNLKQELNQVLVLKTIHGSNYIQSRS